MQTEKKYISAAEAAEIIGSQFGVSVYDMVDIMGNIPAADVAPVVHAEWIGTEADGYDDCGNWNYELWECSKCREEHIGDCDTLPNYCPNCGAKMEGGKNDV